VVRQDKRTYLRILGTRQGVRSRHRSLGSRRPTKQLVRVRQVANKRGEYSTCSGRYRHLIRGKAIIRAYRVARLIKSKAKANRVLEAR
jgi:hypothetical protein